MAARPDSAGLPRRPERANGRKRYAHLVAAAEQVLIEDGLEGLTIQRIAQVAQTPMASVYHFFPSPGAAAVAVAQSYFEEFRSSVVSLADLPRDMGWRAIVTDLMRRTVAFYREHPYATRLIFGSDHSWRIREIDVANNLQMARDFALSTGHHFQPRTTQRLDDVFATAITIADAIWALSVARHGEITAANADEAEHAVLTYLASYERPQ